MFINELTAEQKDALTVYITHSNFQVQDQDHFRLASNIVFLIGSITKCCPPNCAVFSSFFILISMHTQIRRTLWWHILLRAKKC